MTNKQKAYRNSLLSKIHTHSKYKEIKGLGAWGEYIKNRFGVESSASLSIEELVLLLESLNGGEFKQSQDLKGRVALLGDKQEQKIYLLSDHLGMVGVLGEFIYRQTGKRTLKECGKDEKTKIIIGLTKILKERR